LGFGRIKKGLNVPMGKRCKAGRSAVRTLSTGLAPHFKWGGQGGTETLHQTEVKHCWAVTLAQRNSTAK